MIGLSLATTCHCRKYPPWSRIPPCSMSYMPGVPVGFDWKFDYPMVSMV